jgi:predicted TIM-barrel fold metal-dependent hydrolase
VPWIAETIAVAARDENVWIDLSALPAANERAVDAVLSIALQHGLEDRLLFGSDFPVVNPARRTPTRTKLSSKCFSSRRADLPPPLRRPSASASLVIVNNFSTPHRLTGRL